MDNKYILGTEENRDFLNELTGNLVNFGRRFPSPGGGSYYLGDDGTPWTDRPIETWITCRMVHVYSIAHLLGYDGTLELAAKGVRGLTTQLKDKENGGWYAGVNEDGSHLETKQCYAHAFVILAATSALLAGVEGAEKLLDDALSTYDKYFWDDEKGLAVDTWNTEFTDLDDYRGINANMHTVEAFLAVADAVNDGEYRKRAGRIIDHVAKWAKENDYRIPEHFTRDWEPELELNADRPDDPFKPYGATCGHGIEWARLITQWAKSTYGDSEAADKYIDIAKRLYGRAVEDGWNADGAKGIVYTTDWQGKPVVRDRMHWTLAEAMNTTSVLFNVTNEERYRDDFAQFTEYLDETVLDHKNGSWFHQLDENNNPKGTVWPGKSDLYHAFQATLIPYSRVDMSIAKAVCDGEVM